MNDMANIQLGKALREQEQQSIVIGEAVMADLPTLNESHDTPTPEQSEEAIKQWSVYDDIVYFNGREQSEGYRGVISYVIAATVRANPNITVGQIRGLLRNLYAIPEDLTERLSLVLRNVAFNGMPILSCETVTHTKGYQSKHLHISPALEDNHAWGLYTQTVSNQFETDLSAFKPSIYNKGRPRRHNSGDE